MIKSEKIDMLLYQEIGKILKTRREELNMSFDKLSEYIDGKKTKSTLKRYEDGNSRIDMDTLHDICKVLGLNRDTVIADASSAANFVNENTESNTQFANPTDALKFILEQPVFASNIGYDPKKMSDEQLIKLANKIVRFTKMEIEDMEEIDYTELDN